MLNGECKGLINVDAAFVMAPFGALDIDDHATSAFGRWRACTAGIRGTCSMDVVIKCSSKGEKNWSTQEECICAVTCSSVVAHLE